MGLAIFGGNTTDYATWTPSPNGRGTWDILFTCMITLGLCVYSAIHLNIPPPGATVWWKAGMKAKWLFIALLAPEFVAFNAWRQRSEAQHIAKSLRERVGQTKPRSILRRSIDMMLRRKASVTSVKVPKTSDRDVYSLIHGFYVVMGGIRIDMSDDPNRVWPKGVDVLTLHSAAFLEAYDFIGSRVNLLESADAIRDKSKADGLAKILICVQAIWFCAQFFARLHQDLMISLLELNTFAHAICALLIYLLWWEKPLDIDRPTIIETRHTKDILNLCALSGPKPCLNASMWIDSLAVDQFSRHLSRPCCFDCEQHPLSYFDILQSETPFPRREAICEGSIYDGPLKISRCPPTPSFPTQSPPVPAFRGISGLGDQDACQRTFLFTSYNPPILHLKSGELLPGGSMLRVRDNVDFVELDESQFSKLHRIDKLLSRKQITLSDHRRSPFSTREYNFQIHDGLRFDSSWVKLDMWQQVSVGLTLAGVFYGGLHALAWGSSAMHWPVEGTLWKVACLCVICTGPCVTVLSVGELIYSKMPARFWPVPDAICSILIMGIAILHILSRLYLIVEVFLNTAYLPPPAFETPDWSPYFPHFS